MFPTQRSELRQVFSDVSLALLLYTALVFFLSNLSELPYYLGLYDIYYSDWYYYLSSPVIIYPAGFFAFGFCLRHLPVPRLVPQQDPGLQELVSGALVGLGVMYLANLFTQYLLIPTETENAVESFMTETPIGYLVLTTVILAPICEEYIFRRLLQDRLLFLGDWTALVISSLFFGLFHTNLYQFFYATAVGLVLGYIRIMTGKMRWNILLHLFINLFCGVLPEYIYESEIGSSIVSLMVIWSIFYAVRYLVQKKPWRDLYPGPTDTPGREKVMACLTSPAFWICVALHLGLSVYYILPY
ncbi:MAG: CPBP family intramembrane metalloprotease [Oscillospiraceae bacterium]|nr:CPBP family intramembrane metalloprotease [Oscillospiraceae bacterium]